ncbi:hypothetical protein [Corallococcus macrosporus]|uniref:hypothetical protein n=1 Tax=Corallococcus macrosporus TaxID=35 RepID=UPI001F5D8AC0|nr:hypothetical protein [Corallococcus macrosporus]
MLLSYCTRSGTDAVSFGPCGGGSPTNPAGCHTTECPDGAAACCRTQKATCQWSFTQPATSGINFGIYNPVQGSCYAPSACAQDLFTLQIVPGVVPGTCPTPPSSSLYLSVTRPLPTLGQAITLPNPKVQLSISGAGASCYSWTGSVTIHADVPTWRVSVDATCSESGKGAIRLVGSANGDV